MFTTEIQKKRRLAHIKTSVFTTEIRKNRYAVYILKLVCLLLKYKKIGYVVNIKTSIFSTEKTEILYIRNHKISELNVELIATCQSKLLHLDVIYLPSKGRKSFREKMPWFGESKRTPSGYRVTEFQHKLAYTGKCKLCLLYGRCKPLSSSGTAVTPEGCDMSMLWMRGGMWRSRALFRIAVSGVLRNTYTPVPVGKLRLSWFSLQPVHAAPAKNGP